MLLAKNKIPIKIGPGTELHEYLHYINVESADEIPWHLGKYYYLINRYEGRISYNMIVPIVSLHLINKKERLDDFHE